jgi:hypothetical protein
VIDAASSCLSYSYRAESRLIASTPLRLI